MFVEDTYYSDTPDIDGGADRADRCLCRRQGLAGRERRARGSGRVAGRDRRRFRGVLAAGGATRSPRPGVRAGLFHPTTGYSLPDAVRTRGAIAGASDCRAARSTT